jgi:hypothetical protein
MSLTLERRLADSFVPALRRAAFDGLVISSQNAVARRRFSEDRSARAAAGIGLPRCVRFAALASL